MEVIRIPQVSLVDATGKRIGVFNDDPDWWQQLKLKHQTAVQAKKPTPAIEAAPSQVINETSNSSSNSSKQLVAPTTSTNASDVNVAVVKQPGKGKKGHAEDLNSQCNVIGETPLHIAIMYNDFETIRFLIENKGFDVNQRSVGGKFSGGFNSKTTSSLIQQSKYEGLAYYGEYPLAFAACFASKEVYDYLIDNGADPNLQDTYGNTVLHVLVINNKLDMFQYATNHPKKKALLTIKNSQDLTPVNLAAKLGRKDLFSKMLELRNMEFWRYSNITCSAYPLEGLDTVDAEGKIMWNAALSYIVNGETEAHLDMLDIGVVKRLLEDKWSTYAQVFYIYFFSSRFQFFSRFYNNKKYVYKKEETHSTTRTLDGPSHRAEHSCVHESGRLQELGRLAANQRLHVGPLLVRDLCYNRLPSDHVFECTRNLRPRIYLLSEEFEGRAGQRLLHHILRANFGGNSVSLRVV